MAKLSFTALTLLTLTAGCEPAPLDLTDNESPYVVEAVVNGTPAGFSLLASKTRNVGNGRTDVFAPASLTGSITVNGSTHAVVPDPACESSICFKAEGILVLKAGDRADLDLVLDGTIQIAGTAIVPVAPTVAVEETVLELRLSNGAMFAQSPAETDISWNGSGASGAQIDTRVDRVFSNGNAFTDAQCTLIASPGRRTPLPAAGREVLRLYQIECGRSGVSIAVDSAIIAVAVSSLDQNYAAFRRAFAAADDILIERASFGITGTPGVLGAAATTITNVLLRVIR